MGSILAIICGVACGFVAAMPLLRALGKKEVDLGSGFGAVIVAFLGIQAAMFVVLRVRRALLRPFGISCTLVFLACVFVAALRRRRL